MLLLRISAVLAVLLVFPARILSADAPLTAGCAKPPQIFSGAGTTGVTNALNAFQTAIGGVNNGGASSRSNGYRVINWDTVALDGSDFGMMSTTIFANKVVAIPINRFETRGVIFDRMHAVANDGFASMNPGVAGQFPAFSANNTFAPYNNNLVTVTFVLASSSSQATAAATRGFGAVFLDVELSNTTSIEYFNGTTSVAKYFVPVSTSGQPEFLGVLFGAPIVTSVEITLGTTQLFNFDGMTFTSGSADSPGTFVDQVALDDFVYAEPTITTPPGAVLGGTAGSPVTATVATFTDTDVMGLASQFNATIDWGDLTSTTGTISLNPSGCFDVSGTHIWGVGGSYPISVSIADSFIRSLTMQATANIGAQRGDFNGDARSDLMWRGSVDGVALQWFMNGATVTSVNSFGAISTSTNLEGIGDFNADGHADLIWRNPTTGDVTVWLLNGAGTGIQSVVSLGSVDPDYHIEGIGDFNGDGRDDIAWRAQTSGAVMVWAMNGAAAPTVINLGSVVNTYKIEAMGDLNGDGKADLVWRGQNDGAVIVWLTNAAGNGVASSTYVTNVNTTYRIVSAADMTGDGKADILWRGTTDGGVVVWVMNGATVMNVTVLGNVNTAYNIEAVADLNGDGRADLVWRGQSDGNVVAWIISPTLTVQSSTLISVVNTSYRIVGPR